ncbi:kinase-like protein [Westerdykella ornata]|uniref:Kinase-like protein n=1 Tax=Westerdykella ornata TaxID=318751 RepID=A0A6A6JT20_WESOR|nr:kinase-like protein [Westerdykella ornata]KAF2278896.1 kinase-like protein [Westerdykella ornata]
MTSKTLNNVVNEQTVTLNALIYGYAGHSLVTPHVALQQIWWTEERINEKVTTEFITSRLRPNERQWLDRPVGFGDLTDDTYMDWILERARRLFLVLATIGEAEKIFTAVEKAWDDDDLPLQMEDIEKLKLSNKRNDNVNARFYQTQFTFLLRELEEGVHIDYGSNEVLPLEYVMGLPPAVSLQHWSRVHRPKRPNEVYVRRKFPLGTAEDPTASEMDFIMDVESARMIEHDHIAPVWASYTAKGNGYTLTNFVGQHTLRTFIDHRNPAQYQRLPKPERRFLVLGWLHCLADAITTLHQMGFCHSAIRPSNILIDERNRIAFSDIGSLETFQKDKKPDAMEAYVYSAPEAHADPDAVAPDVPAPSPVVGTGRKISVASRGSTGSSDSNGTQRQKLSKTQTNDFSGFNFGFKKAKPVPQPRSRILETEKADIFSLGCIFLELLTFMLKKKPHEFTKHRSSKQKISMGGKNSRADSSFHANLDKIDSWMKIIEEASFAQEDDAFRAVPHIMNLIRAMLSRAPNIRPSARDVRDRLLDILMHYTSIPNIHCSSHVFDNGPAYTVSSSDRASTMSSTSTMTTTTTSSDADTIRFGSASSFSSEERVSSILNSYSDRSTLASVSEYSDADSIHTIEGPSASSIDTAVGQPRGQRLPTPPVSPMSPMSPMSPSSPQGRPPSSPSSPSKVPGAPATYKIEPWNKPFLLLP